MVEKKSSSKVISSPKRISVDKIATTTPKIKTSTLSKSNSDHSSGESSKGFPTQKLQSWLKARSDWNHQDWLELLKCLEKEGYVDLISNQQGRDSIGLFLESNRQ